MRHRRRKKEVKNNTNLAHYYAPRSFVNVSGKVVSELSLFYVFVPESAPAREIHLPKSTCDWDAYTSIMKMPKIVAQRAMLALLDNIDELSEEELNTICAHHDYILAHA